ncbi:MAG: transposase, partial [Oscillospiraceae bacterium]
DKYVIMPNHIHIILILNSNDGTGNPSPTIATIIGWLKYQITKQINLHDKTTGLQRFQRSYHDRIIRNEKEYQKIWEYIETNPLNWKDDCFYLA